MNIFVQSRAGERLFWSYVGIILVFLVANAGAANVLPGTGYTNSFDGHPPAVDWASLSVAGGATEAYDLDSAVSTNITAVGVSAATVVDPGNPPATSSNAVWSSSGFYLQTRPSLNRYTALLGKFVNTTGTNATQISISYLFTIAAGGVVEDNNKGTRVYYSLSGLAGSWVNLASLNSTISTNVSFVLSTNLSLNWSNGTSLFLLWADDNAAASGTDAACQIDDFSLQVTAGAPIPVKATVLSPANDGTFSSASPITATVGIAGGYPSYAGTVFMSSGAGFSAVGSLTNEPYDVSLGILPAGTYYIYAQVTDQVGTANSPTNAFVVANPITFVLTSPADGTIFDHNTSVAATATVAGGTPPYSIQFYLDGVAHGAPVTAEPYVHSFGTLFAVDHTISAVITDARGWVSNSLVHTVHVSGPLVIEMNSPVDGSTYTYGESVSLGARVGGGTTPYTATFYMNEQVVGFLGAAPFTTNLGILPAGSYSIYAQATDSATPTAQNAWSATNFMTILPNPLLITLTSPTNGQSNIAGLTLTMNATASVNAPLIISNVQFFMDDVLRGTDSTAPYAFGVPNPSAGTHSLYAMVTDSLGRQSYSATNVVTLVANPLANDRFVNRIVLTGASLTTTGNNTGAGTEGGEPNAGGFFGIGATLWWSWTAPITGTVIIDTFGSSFNTTLGVYTGNSVNGLSTIRYNDNYDSQTQQSQVSFTATQGVEYQIQVGGGRGSGFPPPPAAAGDIKLNLRMPPYCVITTPTNNSMFLSSTSVLITANATSGLGVVTQVDFYVGNTFLGAVTNEPYSVTASELPLGTNSLFAVAFDTAGQYGLSAPVTVVVLNVGLTLVAPPDGASYSSTSPINVSAIGLLESGAITIVEFFVDDQKFAADGTVPFSVQWTNVTPGVHRMYGVGTDNSGQTYESDSIFIGVAQPVMPTNSVWKYLDTGIDLGTNWIDPSFDDSTWPSGPAPLGYGDANGLWPATTNGYGMDASNKFVTTYYRQALVIQDVSAYTNFYLRVQRDDGIIVYVNGTEVLRQNMALGPVSYTNYALSSAGGDETTWFGTYINQSLLHEGTNVLAVEIHQSDPSSSDIWFNMDLVGNPVVTRNYTPYVRLISPVSGDNFLLPGTIQLEAEASDRDGTVSKVVFYAGPTKLCEVTNAPWTALIAPQAGGQYTFTAVATDNEGARRTSRAVTVTVYPSSQRWTAFNDHYAGSGTHSNATTWNVFGTQSGAPGEEGELRNITSGQPLDAYLSIYSFGAVGDSTCGTPQPGTPAYDTFNGYVDFGTGGDKNHAIMVDGDSTVMYLFTGLDPERMYNLRATVVGGVPEYSNRWTIFIIDNVNNFTPAHTANVLTSANEPALAWDEAAMNTGDNSTGDVIGWDSIVPGPDGVFVVQASQYLGPAPGNAQPGPMAYAPVALKLEEIGANPLVKMTLPLDGVTITGPTNVYLGAESTSLVAITNMLFYANDIFVGQTATNPFIFNWTNPPFGDLLLSAEAVDAEGYSTRSAPIMLHLITPPTNYIPPYIISEFPAYGATVTNLTNIQVIFSQWVYGVDASDLLINGTPATNMVNIGGTNYTFDFTQPPYGLVQIRWATNHGITDLSWPNRLTMEDQNPENFWDYNLIDRTPPTVAAKNPVTGSVLNTLTQITVTFSEPVTGVDAGDFLVNGIPAYDMTGAGAEYTFIFAQPPSGTVRISWVANHGIQDIALEPNLFPTNTPGASWTYLLDAKTILVSTNTYYLYAKGTNEASEPVNAWRQVGFDDSNWLLGQAPFYYKNDTNGVLYRGNTLLSDMCSNYSSVFLRTTFVTERASVITNLLLRYKCDDGAIVSINGVEVWRYNMPTGQVAFNAVSTTNLNDSSSYASTSLGNPRNYLLDGTNVLAVQIFNSSLTNNDLLLDLELYTYLNNLHVSAPRIVNRVPTPGSVFYLTNVTVTFSEPVTNVEASDLLINNLPAATLTSASNMVFIFAFSQPPYGPVVISWATNHGIKDFDLSPKPFNAVSWQYSLFNPDAPLLTSIVPATDVPIKQLTQIAMTFNKPVTGVDAADLLINGVPALYLSGAGANYLFTFPQPDYGQVLVSWAANHGITDPSATPNAFDPSWPGHTWSYTLVDEIPPAVASQDPPAGETSSRLRQITVHFTEPVSGVDASDFLINNKPATSLSGSNAIYTFGFSQPNTTMVYVAWASNHRILDRASNAFNATGPGATWSYPTVDTVPPSLSRIFPGPSATVRSLRQISLSFDEPVSGLSPQTLTINGVSAGQLSGSGAGPYVFAFDQPPTGVVQVALSPGFLDLATPPNVYAGSNWSYVLNTNLALPTLSRGPYLQVGTPTSMVVRWRTSTAAESRVRYGLSPSDLSFTVLDEASTTEHIVTLSNLSPYTVYYYAIGVADTDLTNGVDYCFRTYPTNPVSTRVWFISDYGFRNSDEASVRNSYYTHVASEKPADVWITGGDNDQTDGQDSNYQESVFGSNNGYASLMRKLPMWPTIGNHDYQTGQGVNYYANFTLPTEGQAGGVPSGTEHYYSFNYGDVHFINLDSVDGTLSRTNDTPMLQWLQEDLAATTQRWIIAYWHGPPYSKGTHDSDSTTDTLAWMVQMRENVVPILESHGVDLVLCGHSHVYERTWLLHGHYGFSTTFEEAHKINSGDGKIDGNGAYHHNGRGLGTVYVTAGVSGQPRTTTLAQHPAHLLRKTSILGSLVLDINGGRLDCRYLNTSGSREDYFTIVKDSGAPTLTIARGSQFSTVSWPSESWGYELQRSDILGVNLTWQTITNGINTNGNNKVFNFVPQESSKEFFRLKNTP